MRRKVIDFHAHAFPDTLAPRAMKVLLDEAPGIKAWLDGTTGDLLRSMDAAGIQTSVLCCIATRPAQFEPILEWCRAVRSDRLVPLPSIHPADPDCLDRIGRIREEGFLGIKLHPFYQDFFADEDRMLRFYEEVCRQRLMLVMHTGYDIAFPPIRRADPIQVRRITEMFPDLRFVATHLGAWRQWDEVREHLVGRDIYMETSFAMEDLSLEDARQIIVGHPPGYVLFGTDSPWTDQARSLDWLERMDLSPDLLESILAKNAATLLGMDAGGVSRRP